MLGFGLTDEEKRDYDVVKNKFVAYLNGRSSIDSPPGRR